MCMYVETSSKNDLVFFQFFHFDYLCKYIYKYKNINIHNGSDVRFKHLKRHQKPVVFK